MRIDVQSPMGSLSHPRCDLARAIVLEALARFQERIVRVRVEVPSALERTPMKTCRIFVLVDDGVMLECRAGATNVADAMERAAHDMRRLVASKLGVALNERRRPDESAEIDPRAERRAS